MHLIRRAAFHAASSPSTSFISKQRSITTSSLFALRSTVQSGIAPSIFRRFATDDATSSEQEKSGVDSTDGERGSVREAIESATETTSKYARNAAESLTSNASQAKDSIVDAATGAAAAAGIAYQPREERRESRPYGDRDGGRERRPYDNNRGSDRGGFGGFGGDRGGLQERSGGFRSQPDRILTPTTGIYVGNLLFDVTAADLQREFEAYGKITNTTVASDARGLSKGFGYVEFEKVDQATAAIEAKHQTILEGRRIIVNYMAKTNRETTPNPPSKTLFIGNLAFEMSDADLNKLFRDIRNVIDVRVAIDRRTGQPRGFAHADFVDVESAVKGRDALFDKEVYGRKLRVDFSAGAREGRDSRSGDRGGYGGGRDREERRERY